MNPALLVLGLVLFVVGFAGLYRAKRLLPNVKPILVDIAVFLVMILGVYLVFVGALGA